MDVEEEEGALIQEHFAHKLTWLGYDVERDDVFIFNDAAARWYNEATGDRLKVAAVTRALPATEGVFDPVVIAGHEQRARTEASHALRPNNRPHGGFGTHERGCVCRLGIEACDPRSPADNSTTAPVRHLARTGQVPIRPLPLGHP